MSTQLWPDERIRRDLFNCHTPRGYYKDDVQYISILEAEGLAHRVRDDCQARIDELQALLDAYARRVTDLDAEVAILRQRELERCDALSPEVRVAIAEALDLAEEAIPYAGEYFNEKWDLSARFEAAYAVLRPWLDERQEVDAEPPSLPVIPQPRPPGDLWAPWITKEDTHDSGT